MNLALDRGLSLLEHLSRHPDGLPLVIGSGLYILHRERVRARQRKRP